jgi:hypothetical protein
VTLPPSAPHQRRGWGSVPIIAGAWGQAPARQGRRAVLVVAGCSFAAVDLVGAVLTYQGELDQQVRRII